MSELTVGAPALRISASETPGADWDPYVNSRHPNAAYRQAGWTLLATDVFGFESRFLEARNSDQRLVGVLPLVRQKTLLFGSSVTSIPFFTYGGAAADSPEIADLLMQSARELTSRWGGRYLEVRDVDVRKGDWHVRTDKVSMVLPLPDNFDLLQKTFSAKLRSQAKRADRESATVRRGGVELLDDFYDVFCRNMHELGTPVYPSRFFRAVMDRFPAECALVVVYRAGVPAAGGFVIATDGWAEIPWAACRLDAKSTGFNMKLYWEVLKLVVERGCRSFDFGRSTVGGATYRFKSQWGAVPRQLHWHRWQTNGLPVTTSALQEGKLMKLATLLWQRMPLGLANRLGPLISPGLPW